MARVLIGAILLKFVLAAGASAIMKALLKRAPMVKRAAKGVAVLTGQAILKIVVPAVLSVALVRSVLAENAVAV